LQMDIQIDKARLRQWTDDLSEHCPRSPRQKLGGFVIAARSLDKCRASLLGVNGEYSFWPCSLGAELFGFTGIDPEKFREFVATGATDEEVGEWLAENSKVKDQAKITKWNFTMLDRRISEMDEKAQAYLEQYIEECVPGNRPVYVWLDVYDIEEGRL